MKRSSAWIVPGLVAATASVLTMILLPPLDGGSDWRMYVQADPVPHPDRETVLHMTQSTLASEYPAVARAVAAPGTAIIPRGTEEESARRFRDDLWRGNYTALEFNGTTSEVEVTIMHVDKFGPGRANLVVGALVAVATFMGTRAAAVTWRD